MFRYFSKENKEKHNKEKKRTQHKKSLCIF